MTIKLTPSRFARSGTDGDYRWMIEQPPWAKSLFIFNDNESQSTQFLEELAAGRLDPSSGGCSMGGGNAVIRPYQCQSPPRAAGIPTGPGYDHLTPDARRHIDAALSHVATLLATGRYSEVLYSASPRDPDQIGHGIFEVGEEVRRYIPAELKRLVALAASSRILRKAAALPSGPEVNFSWSDLP